MLFLCQEGRKRKLEKNDEIITTKEKARKRKKVTPQTTPEKKGKRPKKNNIMGSIITVSDHKDKLPDESICA